MTNLQQVIKDWAMSQYGLVIPEEKIESKISWLLKTNQMSADHFLEALQKKVPAVINTIVDAFTVQESYFFRDAPLFHYLKNTLLPQLIKEKQCQGSNQINIWSAGCSYGEEIYSIAIYLNQLLPNIDTWRINLLASDINEAALTRARQGTYTRASMRATPQTIIDTYFDVGQAPYLYVLKTPIRDMVKIDYCNIVNPVSLQGISFDLIFCRNVFIYFDQTHIELALANFYDKLIDNGLLFLGPSDLISYCHHPFTIEHNGTSFHLKKIIQKEPLSIPVKKSELKRIKSLPDKAELLQSIRLLLDDKKYSHAFEQLSHCAARCCDMALFYRYKGEALIGLGDAASALVYLKKAITLDPLDPITYFYNGLVELDMKNTTAAIDSLQKGLYIKNNFPEAAYHLSLIYLKNQQWVQGMKWLHNSLRYAKEEPEEKPILFAEGTMTQLIQAIKANISYYQEQNHE